MSITDQIFAFAENLLSSTGYLGVFALMVLESATLPVPSEVVLPFAGYLVYRGVLEFWLAVVAATVGSLIGTMIDFAVGLYLGRAAILRYGRYIHLNEKNLALSERWFSKYGSITVLLARFVPLIRTLVAFPAGIAEMKIWRFIAYSLVGIFIWDALLIYLGEIAGQNSTQIINSLHGDFTLVEIAAVVIVAVVLVVFFSRRSRAASRAMQAQQEGNGKNQKGKVQDEEK